MKNIYIFILIILFIVALSVFCWWRINLKKANQEVLPDNSASLQGALQETQIPPSSDQSAQIKQPSMQIDKNKTYLATLKTSSGDIVVELNAKMTPITVNNFVYLTRQHFYDNTKFHRVIKGFMIQGGDPNGDGTGGPGYRFDDEPFEGEYTRGTIAMANAGPNTNGSQFFIMHQNYPLPKNYVIFGQVISGIEIVDKIANSEVRANLMGELSEPINPIKISAVKIQEK